MERDLKVPHMTENLRKWYTREWIILFCTIFTI
nr:MAG TPA: hypothetical protein [Caudoviricetes sp.]